MTNKPIVMEQYDKSKNVYDSFSKDVKYLLERLLRDEGIEYNAITCRLKERDSLSRKIDSKKDKYASLSEITDIAGIRVIAYYADDVDRIANIVEQEFVVDKENSIDKREALEPDKFGYCSVHYVVEMRKNRVCLGEYKAYKGLKCEIQIRTVLQHAWAEIEHDLGYKSTIAIPRDVRRNFSRLAGLLEIADKEFQETRQRLTFYREEVENRIADEKYDMTEIDAVSLQTLIDTNNEVSQINSAIVACFEGATYRADASPYQIDDTISMLHYFDVRTLGQLFDFIARNKEVAVKIADEISNSGDEDNESTSFVSTVAFFYLCYAELLTVSENVEEIYEYLSQFNISSSEGTPKDVAMEMFEIKKRIFGDLSEN